MSSSKAHSETLSSLQEIVESTLNKKIIHWEKPLCGLSSAIRYSLQLEDKSKVFVKAATDNQTKEWLITEHLVLSTYDEDFMPAIVSWIEEPEKYPILITEDFSDAYWAAKQDGAFWRNGDMEVLIETVQKLSTIKGRQPILKLKDNRTKIWTKIAENPEKFLKQNFCSENWFKSSIDHLIEAENNINDIGEVLVHGDIRSDNVCIKENKAIFVDWSNAGIGNANYDLANLLPTLHLEGGPEPYQIMPDAASWAAHLAAVNLQRLSRNNSMPFWLSIVFKKLIAIELEWASQCLNLDKPDGIQWNQINNF